MTKEETRAFLAAHALTGLLANHHSLVASYAPNKEKRVTAVKALAIYATEIADATIEALRAGE